jgi:CheY-like chemotaxis protein
LLVVDDNATNREILSRQARSWGMDPVAVELPSEALALVDAGAHFDVAVVDLHMAEMDGLELGREIHRRRPELPLVLASSLGRVAAARGAAAFASQVTKPVKASALFEALLEALGAQARVDSAPAEGVPSSAQRGRVPLRILLAEDNVVNQKLALRFLQQMGYRADVASNGIEAVASVERQTYDVVLMDVQMPEMDGLEATRRIRARNGNRPRIVAMTANATQRDRELCLAAGMDDYLTKPIRVERLVEALRGVPART